jgi:hypothetical protein
LNNRNRTDPSNWGRTLLFRGTKRKPTTDDKKASAAQPPRGRRHDRCHIWNP